MLQTWNISHFPEIMFLSMEKVVLALHWSILLGLSCTQYYSIYYELIVFIYTSTDTLINVVGVTTVCFKDSNVNCSYWIVEGLYMIKKNKLTFLRYNNEIPHYTTHSLDSTGEQQRFSSLWLPQFLDRET